MANNQFNINVTNKYWAAPQTLPRNTSRLTLSRQQQQCNGSVTLTTTTPTTNIAKQRKRWALLLPLMLAGAMLTLSGQIHQSQAFIRSSLPPKLVDMAREYTHLEGSNITLVCSISSGDTESLSFDWLKDDILLNPADSTVFPSALASQGTPVPRFKIDVLPNKEHSTLKILDLTENDAAKYTCLARNSHGQDKLTTRVKVKVPLKWLKEPTNVKKAVGQSVKIPCLAQGSPAPVIKWRRLDVHQVKRKQHPQMNNNQQHILSIDRNIEKQTSDQFIETFGQTDLRFNSISAQDSGVYECIASNGSDEDLTSIIHVEAVGK